jgi:hypothetical protein
MAIYHKIHELSKNHTKKFQFFISTGILHN